jgi:hypothetical protein
MKLDIDKLMRCEQLDSVQKNMMYIIHTDKGVNGYTKGDKYLSIVVGASKKTIERKLKDLRDRSLISSVTKKLWQWGKIKTQREMWIHQKYLMSEVKETIIIKTNINLGNDLPY